MPRHHKRPNGNISAGSLEMSDSAIQTIIEILQIRPNQRYTKQFDVIVIVYNSYGKMSFRQQLMSLFWFHSAIDVYVM